MGQAPAGRECRTVQIAAPSPGRAQSSDLSTAVIGIARGAILGTIAGVAFIVFEMALSVVLAGDAVAPLRMIAAILLGPAALTDAVTPYGLVIIGLMVHFFLAALFGALFALPTLPYAGHRGRAGLTVVLGIAFGLVLWGIDFYLIAPALFPWFTHANPWVQIVAHGLFFGAVLGWLNRPSPQAR
jgi:hypothetical protein